MIKPKNKGSSIMVLYFIDEKIATYVIHRKSMFVQGKQIPVLFAWEQDVCLSMGRLKKLPGHWINLFNK